MASGAEQLSQDFEQVKKLLETYPNIRIINTKGDPPDQYDIEYTIKGYKTNPDGSASPDNKHEVRINLPFGYPHFPPTAKPITPIFHPDIDPDAIRIADFWQEHHSLPELIIHIGQMICGNHYTTEEPFNQSAAEWFEERKSWLPFDILEPRDEEEIEAGATSSKDQDAGQTFIPASDLDILKDDIDFPFDDEEPATEEDELTFEVEESPAGEEVDIEEEDIFDLGIEDVVGTFDLQERDEAEESLSLQSEEPSDDISFDLNDIEKEMSSILGGETSDLFDLETEPPDESTKEEPSIEFDSENFSAAFETEEETAPIEPETVDITLDDLADIEEEEEDELDFGIAEESLDIGDDSTADLSALEEEIVEEEEAAPDIQLAETEVEEEEILSALSLDESSAGGRIEDQSIAIRSLIEQKQIFAAKKVLADLPDPESLPDKKEFELTIADAIGEAEDLYKTAEKHEQKGELEKAGIILDLVANIATDFPGLELARNRIRESMMGGGPPKPDSARAGEEAKQTADEKESAKKKKKARARMGFKVPARLIVILFIVLIAGAIGTGTFYLYNADDKNVQLAQKTFQKAEEFIGRKEFKEADKQLAAARTTLEEVLFFHSEEKDAILRNISSVRSSSLMKEGLKGRVLYGEIYVTIESAKNIDKFNTLKSYAEQILKTGKIVQAIEAYEKALPYAEKAGFDDQKIAITKQITRLRLEMVMAEAKQHEEKQDWLNAKNSFQNALELSKTVSLPEEQNDIARKMATAAYHYGMDEGLKGINDSQWQKSIDAFQEVQRILEANPAVVSENEKKEIDKLLIQSYLYFYLGQARHFYEDREWKKAVEEYNKAINIINENINLIGQEGKDDIKKIEKTILTTHVAEKQSEIEKFKAKNELKKTVENYEAIVNLIGNSEFNADKTLAKILDDARTKTIEIKKQILINEKEKWLTDNYDQIFREHYPSAKSSELLNPKVSFIKRIDNLMIFNISCTELRQGRKFRLELNYQHDLDKKKWSLYSGTLEEE